MDIEDKLEGSVRPAEEGGTELEAGAEEGELEEGDTELEESELAEEGELAGAEELEAEERELEGPVQHAMDELEGSVQRSQRLARLRKRRQRLREWPPAPLPRQLALLHWPRQLALFQLTVLGLGLKLRAALLHDRRRRAIEFDQRGAIYSSARDTRSGRPSHVR